MQTLSSEMFLISKSVLNPGSFVLIAEHNSILRLLFFTIFVLFFHLIAAFQEEISAQTPLVRSYFLIPKRKMHDELINYTSLLRLKLCFHTYLASDFLQTIVSVIY